LDNSVRIKFHEFAANFNKLLDAAGEDPAGLAALGPVAVKGRNEPIEIYRLA